MDLSSIIGTTAGLGGTFATMSGHKYAGAALGALGALFSNHSSINSQKELARYNAELEQQKWIERFNMQNEYNSPSALRERLREAGLNENLALGNISANMAANPSSNSPTGQLSKYISSLELQQQLNQNNLISSQANLNNAKAAEARANEKNINEDYNRKRFEWDSGYFQSFLVQRYDLNAEDLKYKTSLASKTAKEIDMVDALTDLYGAQNYENQTRANLNIVKADEVAELLQIAWERLGLDKKLSNYQIKQLASIVALNGAMQGYYEQQSETEDYINNFTTDIQTENLEIDRINRAIAENEKERSDVKNFKKDKNGKRSFGRIMAGLYLNAADIINISLHGGVSKSSVVSNNTSTSTSKVTSVSKSTNHNYNESTVRHHNKR